MSEEFQPSRAPRALKVVALSGAVLTAALTAAVIILVDTAPQWEQDLRAAVRQDMQGSGDDEICAVVEQYSIDDPQDFVDAVALFAEEGGLDRQVRSLPGVEDLPEDVTVEEALLVAGDEMIRSC